MNLVSLTLNLTFDNAVQDFVLSSYDSKFGAFGDIVCEVEASQENSKYAIQLKHVKDEQKKKIKEVKDVCEPYDIILHTNQKLDFNAEEEKIVFKHGTNTINVVMTKCDAHPWLSTNTNKSYKFKIIENQRENKKIQEIVTTDKLVSMINGPLVICADNEVLPPLYIPRHISRNIIDLEETVVDKFTCAIQLKTNAFPLRKFLQENKNIQEIVTTDKLVSMINGPLVICADNEVLPPLYIPRHISRNIIDVEETVVDKFTCATQLKTNAFPLITFLEGNKEIQDIVTTNQLIFERAGDDCADMTCYNPGSLKLPVIHRYDCAGTKFNPLTGRDDLECKRRVSLEVSLQFASFFQYDVYYKVVSCASNPKESSR
ncbi:hypothetical protein MTP99_014360 [Tenebrio molitor]|nr:hypothetical protein MTP99_014360 [Tenebrio molitor]